MSVLRLFQLNKIRMIQIAVSQGSLLAISSLLFFLADVIGVSNAQSYIETHVFLGAMWFELAAMLTSFVLTMMVGDLRSQDEFDLASSRTWFSASQKLTLFAFDLGAFTTVAGFLIRFGMVYWAIPYGLLYVAILVLVSRAQATLSAVYR